MGRLVIVSRITPGAQGRVAQIFAESDATEMPGLVGVRHRSLYCVHDVCVHLMEVADVTPDALAAARSHPHYHHVRERLSAHLSPYPPSGSSYDDIARCFYRWDDADAASSRGQLRLA